MSQPATSAGTLNGQPVGPELPPSMPCPDCGAPTWVAVDVVAAGAGDELVNVAGRLELDWLTLYARPWPHGEPPWALTRHHCRRPPP